MQITPTAFENMSRACAGQAMRLPVATLRRRA